MNIYVGNLPYSMTEDALRDVFEQYGSVSSVKVITDKISGRSKGFAFVDMPEDAPASEAIEALNGKEMDGRTIVVSRARPKEENNDRRPSFRGNNGGGRSRF